MAGPAEPVLKNLKARCLRAIRPGGMEYGPYFKASNTFDGVDELGKTTVAVRLWRWPGTTFASEPPRRASARQAQRS
jgi:hypothetical protein